MLDVRPTRVYVRECVEGGSAKILTPLVYFYAEKKMLQIILSLIGLSVCLISLCPSWIGFSARLILSAKKLTSSGLLVPEEKLVKNTNMYPLMFTFFTNW